MITIQIPGTPLAMFIVLAVIFAAAVGTCHVCQGAIAAWRMYFEPEPYEEQALDNPPAPVTPPAAEVHVGEVIAAPRADILPPAPPSLDEVPIFAEIPFTLPLAMDFGFNWSTALTASTGAFPVLDEGFVGRERFETPKPKRKRKVTVDVDGDVRAELVAS